MLLATTAIILPEVSFTVPCNTSSGITRHRLPLVQFGAGRLIPSLETMGLTNGSRRPCAPNALTEGFGFSAVWPVAAGVFVSGSGRRCLGRYLHSWFRGRLGLASCRILGWRDWLYGNYCAALLPEALSWCPPSLCQSSWRRFELPSFGCHHRCGRALCLSSSRRCLVFTGAVLVFTAGLAGRRTQLRSLATRSALGPAALLLDVLAAVPGAAFAPDFWLLLAASSLPAFWCRLFCRRLPESELARPWAGCWRRNSAPWPPSPWLLQAREFVSASSQFPFVHSSY